MTLLQLMKMYNLRLEFCIIENDGVELLSAVLHGAAFRNGVDHCGATTFPGWGSTLDLAMSNLIEEIGKYTHIIVPYVSGSVGETLPLSRITSFS